MAATAEAKGIDYKELVRASREAQGLPPAITCPLTLAKVALLFSDASEAERGRA